MNGGRYVSIDVFLGSLMILCVSPRPCTLVIPCSIDSFPRLPLRKKERKGVQLNLITDPLLFFKSITPRYAVFLMLNVEFYNVVFTDY